MRSWLGLLALVVIVSGGTILLLEDWDSEVKVSGGLAHSVEVKVPELDGQAARGAAAFRENCISCHGAHASGGAGGPPLIHIIYEPNHHGDASFVRAVKLGVRRHHWPFGDMPPVAGVSDDQIAAIITYLRTLQRANGIH